MSKSVVIDGVRYSYSLNRKEIKEIINRYTNGEENLYEEIYEKLKEYNEIPRYLEFFEYAGEHGHPEVYVMLRDRMLSSFDTDAAIKYARLAKEHGLMGKMEYFKFWMAHVLQ